jgi:hypothetical protein
VSTAKEEAFLGEKTSDILIKMAPMTIKHIPAILFNSIDLL